MHGLGRVVSWDADEAHGAVIVDSLPAEIRVAGAVVETPDGRDLQPGELVEVAFDQVPGGGYRATRVCPTDSSG